MAVDTMVTYTPSTLLCKTWSLKTRTVSLSSKRIFIFAEEELEFVSPAEAILEMYPDTAWTTSILSVGVSLSYDLNQVSRYRPCYNSSGNIRIPCLVG